MNWIEQAQRLVDETWHQKSTFGCDLCDRSYSTLRALQTHLGLTHGVAGKHKQSNYWKRYYRKNRTKRKQQSRSYYNNHKEQCQASNRAYYWRNREAELERSKRNKKKRKEKE